ncbi:MAG: TetR/AcrR family transcriptional regulator [Pseudomonadota bacterium]
MKRTKKAETTRQHILEAGQELVLQKGFVGVGLQEILRACGVPKGSFYHYFTSKEAFGCALLKQYVDEYRHRVETIFETGDSGRDRLMRYWAHWIDDPVAGGWAERCLVVKLAAEVADLSADMRGVLNDGVESLVARIAGIIEEGREDGSLPPGAPPHAIAQVLYQMWLGAALLAKLGQDPTPLHRALDASERLLACSATTTAAVDPVSH